MKFFRRYGLILLSLILVGTVYADDEENSKEEQTVEADSSSSVVDRLKAIDDVDPKEWGIQRGCVNLSRVRNIDFKDNQSAIITMTRKKKILLRLERECRGIEHNGFVLQTRTNRLCARFDSLRVLNSGYTCPIASLEPYVAIDESEAEKAEKAKEKDKDKD